MSKYTPVNLAYIRYDPVGGADETLSPIILLHGVTGSKEMWGEVPQAIANKTNRKVYAVDSRNHGDTEWTDDFNFDMNADDLLHFMDTLSISRAVLLGHNMGGIASIRAALRNPERIDMLLVEDMNVQKFNQNFLDVVIRHAKFSQEALQLLPVDFPEKDITREVLKFLAQNMPEIAQHLPDIESMRKIKPPVKRDIDGRYVWKTNLDVVTKAMKNGDMLMTEPKGLYQGPSYFIYGTASSFKVNEDEENIRKLFPNAELIPVEKADHSIHIQFPELFTDVVVRSILKH